MKRDSEHFEQGLEKSEMPLLKPQQPFAEVVEAFLYHIRYADGRCSHVVGESLEDVAEQFGVGDCRIKPEGKVLVSAAVICKAKKGGGS